jgi:hypothetical protein
MKVIPVVFVMEALTRASYYYILRRKGKKGFNSVSNVPPLLLACSLNPTRLSSSFGRGWMNSQQLDQTGKFIFCVSLSGIVVGVFGLLGGAEVLFTPAATSSTPSPPTTFLTWPVSLFYFWPLCIPLGLYLVIARWTGDKHFRHA